MQEFMKYGAAIVVGSIARDVILRFDGQFHENITIEGEGVAANFYVPRKEVTFGGTGANIAYGLRLLRQRGELIGCIGKEDAKDFSDYLTSKGIPVENLQVAPGYTAEATIMTDNNDNQVTSFFPGPQWTFNEDNAEAVVEYLRKADYDIKKSWAIVSPCDLDVMVAACASLPKLGLKLMFDPGQQIHAFTGHQLMQCGAAANTIILNEVEALIFKKKISEHLNDTFETVRDLQSIDVFADVNFIVTHGDEGAKGYFADQLTDVDFPVVKADLKDPTGCGDAWRAGYIAGKLYGLPTDVCGNMGALNASLNAAKMGTQTYSYSSVTEFDKLYQNAFGSRLINRLL